METLAEPEQWKTCERVPQYQVSTWGRLRRVSTGSLCKKYFTKRGYGCWVCHVKMDGKKQTQITLRSATLIAAAWLPPKPFPGAQVDHIDGNKANEVITNMEWVDQSTNVQRAYDNGQHPNRPSVGPYLTAEDYDKIRALWAERDENGKRKHSQVAIAKMIRGGISNATVCLILSGRIDPLVRARLDFYVERRALVASLYKRGVKRKEIARQTGASLAATKRYIKQINAATQESNATPPTSPSGAGTDTVGTPTPTGEASANSGL